MTTGNPIKAPPVSLDEYAALPEHPRYELVRGVLVEPTTASEQHEETVSLVNYRLVDFTLPRRVGKVYGGNRGYVTSPDSPGTSRMPDVSYVSNQRLRTDLFGMLCDGAPDLAVEVLSDSNTRREISQKTSEYLSAGGKAVWIIDVNARTLTVHTPGAPPLTLADNATVEGGNALPGFSCPVGDLLPAEQ